MGQFLYVLVYMVPFTNLGFNCCAIYFDSKVIMSQIGFGTLGSFLFRPPQGRPNNKL